MVFRSGQILTGLAVLLNQQKKGLWTISVHRTAGYGLHSAKWCLGLIVTLCATQVCYYFGPELQAKPSYRGPTYSESSVPVRGFSVNLYSSSNSIRKFPNIELYSEAVISCDDLRHTIQEQSQAAAETRLVGEDRTPNFMVGVRVLLPLELTIVLFDEQSWDEDFQHFRVKREAPFSVKLYELRREEPGQNYRAWFFWNFAEALKKASELQFEEVWVSFSRLPTRDIMFKFWLKDLGDLLILKKTLLTHPNIDTIELLDKWYSDESSD